MNKISLLDGYEPEFVNAICKFASDWELKIKDMCARLPYRPEFIFKSLKDNSYVIEKLEKIDIGNELVNDIYPLAQCRLLLRKIEDMSELEKLFLEQHPDVDLEDYYIQYHYDFRGLIDKGLAKNIREF